MPLLDRYKSIGYRFGLSESTANKIVHSLVRFITQYLLDEVIKWPTNEEKQEMTQMINEVYHFPGVIGMIDGTHIEIEQPSERGYEYYNRKDYYSIVLQAVMCEDLRFTNVYTG